MDFHSSFGRMVQEQLEHQSIIWLTTVDTRLSPQPRPVWFLWQDDSFLIFSQAKAHKVRHIQLHPRVALHFNTDARGDSQVIVFTGEASLVPDHPPAHESTAYMAKYGNGIAALEMTPEEFSREYSTAIKIRPTEVRGWE